MNPLYEDKVIDIDGSDSIVVEMPCERKLKVALVLGALVPLALVVWSVINIAPSAARLPDGSTLQVLAVSAGQAKFSTEKWWHQPARRVLPARFQSLVPAAVNYSSVSPADSITVYFQIRGNSNSMAPHPMRALRLLMTRVSVIQRSADG